MHILKKRSKLSRKADKAPGKMYPLDFRNIIHYDFVFICCIPLLDVYPVMCSNQVMAGLVTLTNIPRRMLTPCIHGKPPPMSHYG